MSLPKLHESGHVATGRTNPGWFVWGDLDGFFGLMIDNLVQLLLIMGLCSGLCGMQGEAAFYLYQHILPGAALSILLGNLFYAWQARRLAIREGRNDVTALPYGINTPSLLVYVFFVIKPAYDRASASGQSPVEAARLGWEMGLMACVGSGVIEFFGAFFADLIRRRTPRAALLSTLAGIAIGYISMSFLLQIYTRPIVALAPLAVVLVTYFAQIPFPFRLPGGLIAVLLGTATAWGLTFAAAWFPQMPGWLKETPLDVAAVSQSLSAVKFYMPQFAGHILWRGLQDPANWQGMLSVVIPMGLFNLLGSLQNIESAEAGGDRFAAGPSLAANGMGTLSAALFGSCFPTTIYIGHPGWKGLGARWGYSILNGAVVTLLCLSGTILLVKSIIPLEAGVAIVLWIGIIITAQSFAATDTRHAPAVAIGLFPAICAWGFTVMQGTLFAAGGRTLQDLLTENRLVEMNGYLAHGLISIERGYILSCMLLSAMSAHLIDRKFFAAAFCSLCGAAFAGYGLTHAYIVRGSDVDFLLIGSPVPEGAFTYSALPIAVGYLLMTLIFVACGMYLKSRPDLDRVEH